MRGVSGVPVKGRNVMNERLKKLLEARARTWEQMKDIRNRADENGLIRGEDEEAWNRANADLDKFGTQIEEEERSLNLDKIDRSRLVTPPAEQPEERGADDAGKKYESAFWSMIRGLGLGDLDAEERKVLTRAAMDAKELRALGVGTGSAGGYTVPPAFRDKLVETMKTFGGMLNVAEIINTDSGRQPAVADPGRHRQRRRDPGGEHAGHPAGRRARHRQPRLVHVHVEAGPGVPAAAAGLRGGRRGLLARKLGERIGRILNQHFTTGTGTSQPDGIVTGATIGKTGTTGQTTSVIYDDLVDLIDSIDPAYQANARFMLSQGSRKAIRKLKDTQNRPLWEPSLQVGVPDTILGYGAILNQDMPAMAANAKSILFGDFREAYVIRLVTGVNLVQFNERYMDFLQKGFLSFQRADGTLQNAAAVRAYANSAT
jgi:predicted phage gp36 major capsid-like protein